MICTYLNRNFLAELVLAPIKKRERVVAGWLVNRKMFTLRVVGLEIISEMYRFRSFHLLSHLGTEAAFVAIA